MTWTWRDTWLAVQGVMAGELGVHAFRGGMVVTPLSRLLAAATITLFYIAGFRSRFGRRG